jgi:hypothetical protein
MNPTVASITTHISLLVPQFLRLQEQNMIPKFVMDKLDRIPHHEGNNDGDPHQEYSQWQRWANSSSSHRSRQRRHVDPRLIKSSDNLLSEYVDPQAEQHMSFPEPESFVPTKRKSAPVQAAQKAVPATSHLYPNPDIIHDYDDDVSDLASLFSSHDPYSSLASMSLATTILTEDEGEEEKVQEPFEMGASLHSLQYSNYSSRCHENDCHDHSISSITRKTTGSGSGSGLGQDLRMTMNDSSLNHLTTILRAKSSLIRQQEAIMRDIEERQAAELQKQQQKQEQQQQQRREQQQQRREQQQRELLSSSATAQSAIAVDAGFFIQTPETTGAGPVQDPFSVATITTNTITGSNNSTSRQVAASTGDTWNWLDALRRRRVRIVDETPELVQEQQYQF